jgi:nucleoside-diphosphate-sugar epimerase
MKVIVTGGSGLVGRYVIAELLKHGVDVVNLDLKPSADHPDVPFQQIDLMDAAATKAALQDADTVVHLAAIPNPNSDPGEWVMSVNMVTTYNVLEAVRENRITRIIYGCSESASGFGIHRVEHVPLYVPIDEAHPCWPHETYSFTKYFGELMCQEYARADKIEVVSLRYGWVWFREHRDQLLDVVGHRKEEEVARHLGAYVFAEDVAQAVRLALGYPLPDPDMPFDAFYILAAEPLYAAPTLEAIRNTFGDRTPSVRPPDYFERAPHAPAFNIGKARRLLGYEPRYTCEDI